MLDKHKVFIVITAYNVSESITGVINGLRDNGFENIVVVNDGSRDNTLQTLSPIKGIYLLSHSLNRGQGAALQTGQEFALENGAQFIVHYDGDGQHSPEDIDRALKLIHQEDLDIVIGTRFLQGAQRINMPFKKILLLKLGVIFTWFVSGVWLSDTHNGFRVMKSKLVEVMPIKMDRFEHASEILDEIKRRQIKYKEMPITVKYTDYSNMRGQKIWNSINIFMNVLIKKINDILVFQE